MDRFPQMFSTDFDENKKTVEQLTKGATTRVRNQVAGYITHTYTITQPEAPTEEEGLEETIEASY